MGSQGQYWHQGFESNCMEHFVACRIPQDISLNINIDGLPIYESSRDEFWPILCSINEQPNISSSVIGIYRGKS